MLIGDKYFNIFCYFYYYYSTIFINLSKGISRVIFLCFTAMDKKKGAKGGAGKPPRIMQHVKSVVANDGDPVTLLCSVKCKNDQFYILHRNSFIYICIFSY